MFLGPENKEEIAKKIVNVLAEEGVKNKDVPVVLSCVMDITQMKLKEIFEIENGKNVQPAN
jgi:hypothetical protein